MGADLDAPRILVLGANGQVGQELRDILSEAGEVIALARNDVDFAEPERLRTAVRDARPQAIVNAAAYTAVDRAESEPELADAVNAIAPGVLANEADKIGACIVHYSTDYVFDGTKDGPYTETDNPNPLSVYGLTKLGGERAVTSANPRHLVLRTSWVVSPRGANFVRTILRLAAERDSLRVVADQRGAPTTAKLLAKVTRFMLGNILRAPADDARWGLYHVVPTGETTWHGLAVHVVSGAIRRGMPLRATPGSVAAITTSEYPAAARRPANSVLDTAKLRRAFPVPLPDWRVDVDDVLDQLISVT